MAKIIAFDEDGLVACVIQDWASGEVLTLAYMNREALERTMAIVAPFSDDDVERVTDPIMSPLAWDLAHIAAYEDLWLCHRHGGLPLLHPELATMYDAFESPREVRGDLPLLCVEEALEYLAEVRARGAHVIAIATEGDDRLEPVAEEVIYVPRTDWMLQALLAVIPLQLFAYYVARKRGSRGRGKVLSLVGAVALGA